MTETLHEARLRTLEARWLEGAHCPCCDQFAKVYRRKFTSSMSRALIYIYGYFQRPDAETWLHVDKFLKKTPVNCREFVITIAWGVIERMPGERPDGSRRVGYYRITDLGKAFVERRAKIPARVYFYNQESIGQDDKVVSIDECLGVKFDYGELMAPEVRLS